MMKSPYIGIDDAFAPMFTEVVEYTTSTGVKGTVPCCFFPIEEVDPFVETDIDNETRRANILIRRKDWLAYSDEPKVGNSVSTPDGRKWKVETYDLEQDWYKLGVRSI